jgi:hypothetical protein
MANPFDTLSEYELRHLPRHLAQAERSADLFRILRMEHEPTGSTQRGLTYQSLNAWYSAVTGSGGVQQYLDHLAVATGVAERVTYSALNGDGGEAGMGLANEFHFALCAVSVSTAAANVSIRLLASLVRRELITRAEAMSYVRQVPDSRDRAEGLAILLEAFDDDLDDEQISEIAGDALAAISTVADEFWRVGELGRLVPLLPAALLRQASAIAAAVEDPYYRLVGLAMTNSAIGPEMAAEVEALHYRRKNIMATEYSLDEVAAAFREEYTQRRAHAVATLTELVREGRAEQIASAYWLAEAYGSLADESEDYLARAVESAGGVGGQRAYYDFVRAVAVRSAEAGLLEEARAIINSGIPPLVERLTVMAQIGLPVDTEVRDLPDPADRLRVNRARLPRLDPERRTELLDELLAAAEGEGHDGHVADCLLTAAPYLDDRRWETALRAVAALGDDEQRMCVLGTLAIRGSELGRADAREVLASVRDDHWYSVALDGMVPVLLKQSAADEVLALAATSPSAHRRVMLTATVAVRLPEPARTAALDRARDIAMGFTAPTARARALVLLASVLDGPPRERALAEATDAALSIEVGYEPFRSGTLAAAAAAWAAADEVAKALELTREITDEYFLAEALIAAASSASPALLSQVLARARAVRTRREQGRVLVALARRHAVVETHPVTLHERWREALQMLALNGRDEFLHDVTGLLPVAEALEGPFVLADIARSGQDAVRWWP